MSGSGRTIFVRVAASLPTAAALALLLGIAATGRAAHDHSEVRDVCVVGQELRVVMQTAQTSSGLVRRETIWSDVRGWIVAVDLSPESPFAIRLEGATAATRAATRADNSAAGPPVALPGGVVRDPAMRVWGPLWTKGSQRLLLDSQDVYVGQSALARENRRRAADAPPFVAFDAAGTPIRVRIDPRRDDGFLRDELDLAAADFAWRGETRYPAISGSGRTIAINARRWRIYRAPDGNLFAGDFLTGDRVQDAWLDAALTAVQAMPHLNNLRRIWLTDDGQYLVVKPSTWEPEDVTAPPPQQRVDTFTIAGRAYRRAGHGFYFRRPETTARVFTRETSAPDPTRETNPSAAISIDGLLYLLNSLPDRLRLSPVDGGKPFDLRQATEATPNQRWGVGPHIQHFPAEGRLVEVRTTEPLRVLDWNYRTGRSLEFQISVHDVFDASGGSWRPKVRPLPVK